MSSQKQDSNNLTEILALVNLLIKKGVITEQEFLNEVIVQKKEIRQPGYKEIYDKEINQIQR